MWGRSCSPRGGEAPALLPRAMGLHPWRCWGHGWALGGRKAQSRGGMGSLGLPSNPIVLWFYVQRKHLPRTENLGPLLLLRWHYRLWFSPRQTRVPFFLWNCSTSDSWDGGFAGLQAGAAGGQAPTGTGCPSLEVLHGRGTRRLVWHKGTRPVGLVRALNGLGELRGLFQPWRLWSRTREVTPLKRPAAPPSSARCGAPSRPDPALRGGVPPPSRGAAKSRPAPRLSRE